MKCRHDLHFIFSIHTYFLKNLNMDKIIMSTPAELSNLIEESLKKVLIEANSHDRDAKYLPELLSITQAAEFLNLAKQTLYGFTSKGEIPYLKKGKKLYFKKSELLKWVNAGKKI